MSDLTVVQGDQSPPVNGTLTRVDGTPYDLTDRTVRFQMRLGIDRRWWVDAPAVVVSPTAGTVRYDWQAGDLATAGEFISRWQITFLDGTVEHTLPETTITVAAQ